MKKIDIDSMFKNAEKEKTKPVAKKSATPPKKPAAAKKPV